ncbi:polymorphic toxin-type HINT domain-containing protein [Streptomyces sp. NPDC020299]|uniref:polymorphic toxin-type HINT domain-containing protein n=1 Tax=Streptomyces sp. NPDC020299 TaxID=3365067 RepID=UPI00378790C4
MVKGSKSISDKGDPQSQSLSVTRYFQGTGGEVKDSTRKYTLLTDDAPQYAGMTAETITYRDSDGQVLNRTLNYPWSKQTASRSRENEDGTDAAPLLAHRTGIKRTDAIQMLDDDGSWRAVRTLTEVDPTYGLPVQVETAVVKPDGSGETLSEQTCTRTSYVHNTTAWLIGLPKEQRTTGTSCAGYDTADPATKLKSAVRNSYDKLAYGSTPAKGLATSVAEIDGAGTSYPVVTDTTYDDLGRVRTVTKPGAGTSETQYTPEAGGPVTATKTINAKGQATTTTLDPGRVLPLTVTDANGRVTRSEYDDLGRLVKGWSPSRSSGGKSPNIKITYDPAIATSDENHPAAVTVQTLRDDGSYADEVTLYDGLMREVQTQTEAHGPGRIIADTTYDDHGLVDRQTGAYLAKGEPDTGLFEPRSSTLIPTWTKHRYDGLDREIRAAVYHDGDYKYSTYTSYGFSSTYVNPAGSTAPRTKTSYDALGRVTSVKHYTQDDSDSSAGRTTTYEYDARGNRAKVTDPAGNAWTYTYDARGRVTSSDDPDTGTTQTWYDTADRPNRVKNARQQDVFTEYDILGRARFLRFGSPTASPVREYTYDDAPGGIGKPYASIRHTDNGDYVNRVTGYDADYHVTGSETVIPANSMTTGLAGTYAYSYTYTPTGKPATATLPATGGLAREKVVTRYTTDGLPESTSGLTWYTADVTYSPYGEPLRTVSGSQPYRVWTTNFVDPHTGSLQRTVTDRETADPHRIADSHYSYDTTGTITSNARELTDAAGDTWDTQCFTYDVLGELVHAWTSAVAPGGKGTGCKASNGKTWGYRTDYTTSSGPVTDAPDAATDTTSPDADLTSTLSAAAPDTTTLSTGATAYYQSFTFDWLGNRATMTDHDPTDATKNATYSYGYGKTVAATSTTPAYTAQPHTVTSTSSSPSGKGSAYTYDATGNTTVRNLSNTTQNLTWSPDNMLDSLTADGKKTTYVYDADGNRLLENSSAGSTLYLGETELTTNTSGTITKASRSYTQSGAPTVVRTTTNGATTGHKLNVLIADQLGTANTSVELSSTQPIIRRAFKPYGETRGTKPSNWPNRRSYLGVGIDDTATGLTHMGAREYDQNSGRFLSADPVIDLAAPLQMNGYAYSGNSPISKSDPTGLWCSSCNDGQGWTRPDGGTQGDPNGGRNSDGSVRGTPNSGGYSGGSSAGQSVVVDLGDGKSTLPPKKIYREFQRKLPGIGQLQRNRVYFSDLSYELMVELYFRERCSFSFTDGCSDLRQFYDGWKHVDSIDAVDTCPVCDNVGFQAILERVIAGRAGKVKWGSSCTQCFLAGTDVLMADGKTKNIEDVKIGEKVLATDPETGESGPRTVTALIVTEHDKHFNELSIATPDGIEKLTATYEHPFWSPSEHAWLKAAALKPGMTLLTDKGHTVLVTGNRPFSRYARTYNLTVDDLHTYYVLAGKTPVLVHNSNCLFGTPLKDGIFGQSKAATQTRIQEVVDFYDMNGRPPAMTHQGGRRGRPAGEYGNGNGQLPDRPLGYYTESDVWPSGRGTGNRGVERLVFGGKGEVYYTSNHYDNFIRLR